MKQKDSCRFNKHVTGITNEPIQFLPLKMNINKNKVSLFFFLNIFRFCLWKKKLEKTTECFCTKMIFFSLYKWM